MLPELTGAAGTRHEFPVARRVIYTILGGNHPLAHNGVHERLTELPPHIPMSYPFALSVWTMYSVAMLAVFILLISLRVAYVHLAGGQRWRAPDRARRGGAERLATVTRREAAGMCLLHRADSPHETRTNLVRPSCDNDDLMTPHDAGRPVPFPYPFVKTPRRPASARALPACPPPQTCKNTMIIFFVHFQGI